MKTRRVVVSVVVACDHGTYVDVSMMRGRHPYGISMYWMGIRVCVDAAKHTYKHAHNHTHTGETWIALPGGAVESMITPPGTKTDLTTV